MADFYPRIRAALTPVIVAACAVMVAAGGMLIYGGFLGIVWPVTLVMFLSPLFFPILLVPAALFAGLMQIFTARGKPRGAVAMQALSAGWLIFVMAVSGALVFDLSQPALETTGWMRVAARAWCVAGAVAPWAVFARGDRDNVFFTGLVLMLLAGTIVAAALVTGSFWAQFLIIAGVMAMLTGAEAVYEETVLKKKG